MLEPVCPICKKAVEARVTNKAFPFCSSRCKLLDLGNWLNESYRVPAEPVSEDDGEGDDGPGGSVH
ncbi:MAG: DNA gyrase inhibitor YacG [Sandaracinaceae bacterium]|nr:DNA gyrase inhibitor YacG [Sandaracinaceae bacterium]